MTAQKRQSPRPKKTTGLLSIREITRSDGYTAYRVEGWKDENGRRKLKQFASEEKAKQFVAEQQIVMRNAEPIHVITTRLRPEQVEEAERAFHKLGSHSLEEAVAFFLGHAAKPDSPTSLTVAIREFLSDKEKEGLRAQSIRQLESTLNRFKAHAQDADCDHVHECGTPVVKSFLKSVRAKNGVDPATPKTWNNYRADLSSFFSWCSNPEERRWIEANPCAFVMKRKDDSGTPDTLTVWQCARLMRDVETFKDGALVPYFALALLAGIRPGPEGELHKLAKRADLKKLIDLKRGIITIPKGISKVRRKRNIIIRPALRAWLEKYNGPILPTNHSRMIKELRRRHQLSHDVLRHSFITYHVAAFRSVGEAALEAGNSEAEIKRSYLNDATVGQGEAFWRLAPKEINLKKPEPQQLLKAV
ncbi:MAG: tyrosine-type recombinase/integrase [Verrucomicrobiales bacterium]